MAGKDSTKIHRAVYQEEKEHATFAASEWHKLEFEIGYINILCFYHQIPKWEATKNIQVQPNEVLSAISFYSHST